MQFFTSLISALPGTVAQGLIWGIMAMGVYLTYKILDFADLTVDGSLCTGAAVAVVMIESGVNVYVAMLCAFLAGCCAGLITGLLHSVLGIPGILSGILTQLALYSINLRIMGKSNLPFSLQTINGNKLIVSLMFTTKTLIVLGIFIVLLIAVMYWFFGTEIGAATRATGCNKNMARAQGINTSLTTILGLVISNGLVGLSGGFLAQLQGNADINMGRGAIVIGLAAVVIGEVVFGSKHGFIYHLVSVVFGAIFYFIAYQIVIQLGLKSEDMKLITSAIVAVFLAAPYLKSKYFTSVKTGNKENGGKANA